MSCIDRDVRSRSATFMWIASLLAIGLVGCWGEHQIGPSKETFRTVDALYTAVGLRDLRLVQQSENKLKSLRDDDQIPTEAADTLFAIVAEAKAGSWEPAQLRLSQFMEGQRR